MAQNRYNTGAFIEEKWSAFIIRTLEDGLLPDLFYRNIGDFTSGSIYHIKSIGEVTIQDGAEEVPYDYTPIETGTVQMTITDHIGDGWYVTDELRQDGDDIDALMATRAYKSSRAIKETFETRFLARSNTAQLDAQPNTINGFAHRVASAEPNNVISLDHFVQMKLAFDKANVPSEGRVAIVDPVVAATLASKIGLSHDVTPFGQRILENGFDRDHRFLMNIMGWDVIESNRLAKGTFSDGTTSVADGVANIFMSMASDDTKPLMGAWRHMPYVEQKRNTGLRRDEYMTYARFGFGVQRVDSLGVVITSATQYK